MVGASKVGGVDERALLAIEAGCDVILLCNDRPGTEQLLSSFSSQVEPITQVRLMRMHGKGKARDREDLFADERWVAASADISRVQHTRVLDLGDDLPR